MTSDPAVSQDRQARLAGELPWWQPDPRRRRQPLDVDRIVAAAVDLLDAEDDIESLSLRRLGARLGVAAASVYWHVPNKQALLDLVLDRLLAELPADVELDPGASWRAQLAEICRGVRRLALRHPVAAVLLAHRLPVGPNGLALMEVTLRTLSQAGFHGPRLVMAHATLLGHATGLAVLGVRPIGAEGAASRSDRPGTADQTARLGELLRHVPRSHFPQLFEASEQMTLLSDEEQFEYGLQRLLDGIEADLRGAQAPRRRF